MSSLQTNEAARLLFDGWAENLVQVLESMTDQRPEMTWQSTAAPAGDAGAADGTVWWEQRFNCPPPAEIWVSAPRQTWEYAGNLTLTAAGLESASPDEVKNTWIEILGQWLSAFSRALGSHLGHEVTSEPGTEAALPQNPSEWFSLTLRFGETELPPVLVALSAALTNLLTAPPPSASHTAEMVSAHPVSHPAIDSAPIPRTMELLLDVELPVSISFGKAQLPLKEVLKLTTGSIVELNRAINEPVEILVNHSWWPAEKLSSSTATTPFASSRSPATKTACAACDRVEANRLFPLTSAALLRAR
jgi:flagellar motor switch protein FliN/FliY